ncbi:MAG: 30S ribosomal protein S4 [Planctomycetia bacterium]
MGRYTGPKLKKSKRVRAPISDTTKHMKAELENGPGVHGARRRGKTTIYGDRLREKQKLAFFYSIGDRQFRRYMAEATRTKTNTGQKLNELLERRLDNVLRRAALARTIWQARQMVVHGHVNVNGHRVDRPSCQVKPGDVIAFRPKKKDVMKAMAETADQNSIVPSWIEVNRDECTIKVLRLPTPDEIFRPFEANMQLVVEF